METKSTKSSSASAVKSASKEAAKKGHSKETVTGKPRFMRALMLGGFVCFLLLMGFGKMSAVTGVAVGLAATKFGLLVLLPEGQIRSGKAGTMVWNKNGTMRVNAFPALVQNAFTTAIRATLGSFSSAWASLTQDEQNGWLNAEGWTTTNRVGTEKPLKGKTLYTTLNTNLDLIGHGPITAVPSRGSVPSPLYSARPTIDVSSTAITMNLSNGSAALGVSIEATAVLSFGSNSPGRNKYRSFFADDDSSAITATDVWTAYASRFSVPVAGQTIFLRCKFIDKNTGQMSGTSQSFKVIVQA